MKYQLQRVDLQTFLRSEVPLGALSADLRQRIRHALASGGNLPELGGCALRELLASGTLRRAGTLLDGHERVPVYALKGSTKVYDLRSILSRPAAAVPSSPTPATPESEETKTRAKSGAGTPHANVPAMDSLHAIRRALRRDWVSYGLEASLEDLLAHVGERLGDPGLKLRVFSERLGATLSTSVAWELADETSAQDGRLLLELTRHRERGLDMGERRWFGVWVRDQAVAALGCRPDVAPDLAVEAAGVVGDLFEAAFRSQSRVFSDPLTGVNNRSFFDHQFPVELERARRADSPVALLFADLDHFKKINDAHGHQVGDLALRHVAHLFLRHLRRIDYVFRWGGEEFALLLPGTDTAEARYTAERLRSMLQSTPVTLPDGSALSVTVSIGVAVFPDHATGEHDLLRHADEAVYRAKRAGRNRVEVWASSFAS